MAWGRGKVLDRVGTSHGGGGSAVSATQVKLDNAQRQIAEHIHGGLLVMAPVGTGKTLVLAERMANAIASKIEPKRILGLTFTNRACMEMRERVRRRYPQFAGLVRIQTFHGLCASMLRTEARYIGLPCDFVIYDEDDCVQIIKELVDRTGRLPPSPSGEYQTLEQLYRDVAGIIQRVKVDAPLELVEHAWSLRELFRRQCPDYASWALQYQEVLADRHALDFADLILMVRVMLENYPDARERWMNRFDLIQVDEVQDTHMSEYEVVRCLALRTKNLAFVGDTNQTIYEWRGSQPRELLKAFDRDFSPITKLSLEVNYRATEVLVRAANSVASHLRSAASEAYDSFMSRLQLAASSILGTSRAEKGGRAGGCRAWASAEKGEKVCIRRFEDGDSEAQWVSGEIKRIVETYSVPYYRIGVLTRTNKRGADVSKVFSRENLPHITVEQFRFFERMEIKDALACLKILVNPRDRASVTRVLLKLAWRVGESTIADINRRGEEIGLALSDFVTTSSYIHGDPFYRLLEAWDTEGVVVLDVETTDIYADVVDVVEIAAARVVRGEVVDTYRALLRNTVPVGPSESIHHYSDEFLRENGRDPAEVFGEFSLFVGRSIVTGHNAHAFDVPVIESHMCRLGLPRPDWVCYDTLDLAQRFVKSPGYSLEVLADTLGLSHKPTHQASDDVGCTCDLLCELIPEVRKHASDRQELVMKYGSNLKPFASLVDGWRTRAKTERPPAVLEEVMETSGLKRVYAKESDRLYNFGTLCDFFRDRDEPEMEPWDALQHLIKLCAISTNVDLLSEEDNRVPVITVHQAKGLEFDYVFIVGATDSEFPSFRAIREGRHLEEARIFYVAVTRARKQLFITYPARDWKYPRKPSPFLQYFEPECVSYR